MSEFVIPRATKFRTRRIIIMIITFHSHSIGYSCFWASMIQRVPLGTWIYYSGIGRLLDRIIRG